MHCIIVTGPILMQFFTVTRAYFQQHFRSLNWMQVGPKSWISGKPKELNHDSLELSLRKEIKDVTGKDPRLFDKVLRIKCCSEIYTGKEYTKARKTVNYVVLAHTCGRVCICSIHFFLLQKRNQDLFFVAKELPRKKNWQIVESWKSSQLMKIEEER